MIFSLKIKIYQYKENYHEYQNTCIIDCTYFMLE